MVISIKAAGTATTTTVASLLVAHATNANLALKNTCRRERRRAQSGLSSLAQTEGLVWQHVPLAVYVCVCVCIAVSVCLCLGPQTLLLLWLFLTRTCARVTDLNLEFQFVMLPLDFTAAAAGVAATAAAAIVTVSRLYCSCSRVFCAAPLFCPFRLAAQFVFYCH